MGISIIGTIILSAYVAYHYLTNQKTDLYNFPELKLKNLANPIRVYEAL